MALACRWRASCAASVFLLSKGGMTIDGQGEIEAKSCQFGSWTDSKSPEKSSNLGHCNRWRCRTFHSGPRVRPPSCRYDNFHLRALSKHGKGNVRLCSRPQFFRFLGWPARHVHTGAESRPGYCEGGSTISTPEGAPSNKMSAGLAANSPLHTTPVI